MKKRMDLCQPRRSIAKPVKMGKKSNHRGLSQLLEARLENQMTFGLRKSMHKKCVRVPSCTTNRVLDLSHEHLTDPPYRAPAQRLSLDPCLRRRSNPPQIMAVPMSTIVLYLMKTCTLCKYLQTATQLTQIRVLDFRNS